MVGSWGSRFSVLLEPRSGFNSCTVSLPDSFWPQEVFLGFSLLLFQEPAPPPQPALAYSACPVDLGIPQSSLPEPSKPACSW